MCLPQHAPHPAGMGQAMGRHRSTAGWRQLPPRQVRFWSCAVLSCAVLSWGCLWVFARCRCLDDVVVVGSTHLCVFFEKARALTVFLGHSRSCSKNISTGVPFVCLKDATGCSPVSGYVILCGPSMVVVFAGVQARGAVCRRLSAAACGEAAGAR